MPRLADLAMLLTGVTPERGNANGARFIQIKDLDPARRALISGEVPTAGRAVPVRRGDVLVASRGERVTAVEAEHELVGAYPTLDVYLIRPDPDRLDAAYLAAFLNRASTAARLKASRTGTTLPRVPKEALAELDVPLPGIDRQRLIGCLAAVASMRGRLLAQLADAEARLAERLLDHAFVPLPNEVQ